jgi:putative endonuclease
VSKPGSKPGSDRRRRAEARGRLAETVAVLLLRLKGYRILARRLRLAAGEIDIVAARGRTVAFVEVKARADLAIARDSVGPRQRRRLLNAAALFVARHPRHAGADLRFDLMLVAPRRFGIAWPRHVVDAWRADSSATE